MFGIRSDFTTVSARPTLLETALGAFRHTWRRPRRSTARLRWSQALAELDDRLLRDIGAIRERGVDMSADAARREVHKLVWGRDLFRPASPAEASGHKARACKGFAQAGNRFTHFGIMLSSLCERSQRARARNRSSVRRAIAAGASSGIPNTELTLISHST